MMDPNPDINELLCDYLEGLLDPAATKKVEAMLARHPRTRKRVEQLRAQRDILRNLPAETLPPATAQAIRDQIETPAPLPMPARNYHLRLVAAALLVGAGLGIYMFIPSAAHKAPAPVALHTPAQPLAKDIASDANAVTNPPAPAATPRLDPSSEPFIVAAAKEQTDKALAVTAAPAPAATPAPSKPSEPIATLTQNTPAPVAPATPATAPAPMAAFAASMAGAGAPVPATEKAEAQASEQLADSDHPQIVLSIATDDMPMVQREVSRILATNRAAVDTKASRLAYAAPRQNAATRPAPAVAPASQADRIFAGPLVAPPRVLIIPNISAAQLQNIRQDLLHLSRRRGVHIDEEPAGQTANLANNARLDRDLSQNSQVTPFQQQLAQNQQRNAVPDHVDLTIVLQSQLPQSAQPGTFPATGPDRR